ncbi:MAG: DUF2520 domain-containing protein [Planctomycetota bacterium]|nr:MAG: DUF2520 domain-containing protein [Planctomycetota bacterium]
MSELPTLAIIGPGKVGTSIGILAVHAGYPVVAVAGRTKESTNSAARQIGKNVRPCSVIEAAQSATVVLLCLPDDAIEQVCTSLAQRKKFLERAVVVHFSGVHSSTILSAARDCCQCSVASMHPLQTFPTVDEAIKKMSDTYCFYEGDERAIPVVERLAKNIGLIPIRIASTSKPLYHAAAVMACNYLVALMDSAIMLAENAGIDRKTAWSALEPLVRTTLNNISKMGTISSLTGPIARGDLKTVSRHLQESALAQGHIASIYRTMGLYTVEMAIRKGSITQRKAEEIIDLLLGSDNSHT